MILYWQDYARWLASTNGMDIYEAVNKAGSLYERQYKKSFQLAQESEIEEFWDEYWTVRERVKYAVDQVR